MRKEEEDDKSPSAEKDRSKKEEDEDSDESEDEDYDPNKKRETEAASESEDSDDEKIPDYSKVEASVSDVRTRSQKYASRGKTPSKRGYSALAETGLVREIATDVDIDAVFESLKSSSGRDVDNEWKNHIEGGKQPSASEKVASQPVQASEPAKDEPGSLETEKVQIKSSYVFAGRVITETKLVDADSAVAKAYLNSTNTIASTNVSASSGPQRSSVPVIREVPGFEEPLELRIKLKRPSLIDKFLSSTDSKKLKLSTLEKSRLDWASFVDARDIKDELALGNKDGYLEKQDFLGRVQHKRDEQYQNAQVKERERQWRLQQQSQI